MKYFDQDRVDELTSQISAMEAEIDAVYNNDGRYDRCQLIDAMDQIRELKDERNSLPIRYEVGDGINSGGNGDRYPYHVVEVSKSGKSIKVRRMGYKAAGEHLPMGHQEWEVYYLPEEETSLETITLRKNGKWAKEGQSSTSGYGNFYPGAVYTYNWEF